MRTVRTLLFLIAIAATACGEEVDFSSVLDSGAADGATSVDASTASRDATPEMDAPAMSIDGALDSAADASPADGGCQFGFGQGFCRKNGSPCRSARDCCTNRCDQGYCLPSNACAAPGVPCDMRVTCCSNRCEPDPRTGALVCAQYCRADGDRCDDPSECCSLGCNGGTCGGALCSTAGEPCMIDSECCSARCFSGRCQTAPAQCVPTGEACNDGGPPCCGVARPGSTLCNPATGRCDYGVGNCLETSSLCESDGDCCRGRCLRNMQGVMVCTAPCLADGLGCYSDGDCCGGICGGMPAQCATLPPGCP